MRTPRPATGAQDALDGARRHAAALDGPTAARDAGRPRRPVRRRLAAAAVVVAAGGGLTLTWAWNASSPGAPAAAAPTGAGRPEAPLRGAPPGAGVVVPSGAVAAAPAPPVAGAPATASHLSIARQGGTIRMDLRDAPLADAVKALADVTRTRVRGGDVLLALTTERTTLQWEGTSPIAAWEALLGRVANISASCSGSACELWIVGSNAARTAPGGPGVVPANGARPLPGTPNPPAAAAVPVPAPIPGAAPITVPQPEPQDAETH